MNDPTPQTLAMHRRYRWQAAFFDPTRWPVLLRRQLLAAYLRPARRVVEVGCGTGHNLAALHRAAGPASKIIGIECAPAMARRAARSERRASGIQVVEAEFGARGIAPACDAIVFSYSLSMIPEFQQVLARAHAQLAHGGQVLVLDFVDSPCATVRWAMRRAGVSLGEARWQALRSQFGSGREFDWVAWGGLWRYRLVVTDRS